MPSLIPAEVFQRAYLARAMPGMMAPPPAPRAAPQQNPMGDLMRAFQMQQQGNMTRPGGTGTPGPMGDSVYAAAMMNAANLSDDEKDKYGKLPPDQLKQVLALRHQAGMGQPKTKPQQDYTGLLTSLGHLGIPPEQMEVYKQHLATGGTGEQVMAHAHQFLQGQATQKQQEAAGQRTAAHAGDVQRQEQLRDLQHQETTLSKRLEQGESDPGIQKDLDATRRQLMTVRGGQPAAAPSGAAPAQQPKPAAGGVDQALLMRLHQQAGGDKEKFKELARQAGL